VNSSSKERGNRNLSGLAEEFVRLESDGGGGMSLPLDSIGRQSNSWPGFELPLALVPVISESRESPREQQSIESTDWADPDLLISLLGNILDAPRTALADHNRNSKNLWFLTQFQKRVAKAHWRFRHPRVRSVHAMLTMGGYDHAESMSLCGTFNPNPFSKKKKYGYCSKRRFCQCCSWRDGDARAQKYLPSFNQNSNRIHGITISWAFPNRQLGLPFLDEREWDVQRLWDVTREAVRLATRSGGCGDGLLLFEQIVCTSFCPLLVNPHNHGFVIATKRALPSIKSSLVEVTMLLKEFKELEALYGPLRPDIKFEVLKRDVDAAKWLNYCFTAFGLGRSGSCLTDVYSKALSRFPTANDRFELNRQVAVLVEGVDHICFDRIRAISLGRFSHRSKRTLKVKPTKHSKAYVNSLYEKVVNVDAYDMADNPVE